MLSLKSNLSLLLLSYFVVAVAAQDAGGLLDTLMGFVEPVTQSFQRAQDECGAGISACTITTTLREVALFAFGCFTQAGGCPLLGGGEETGDGTA